MVIFEWMNLLSQIDPRLSNALQIVSAVVGIIAFLFGSKKLKVQILLAVVVLGGIWFEGKAGQPSTEQNPSPVIAALPYPAQIGKQFDTAFRLAGRGECEKALEIFNAVERADPNYPTLYFQEAYCLRIVEQLPAALIAARMALEQSLAAGGRQGLVELGHVAFMLAEIEVLSGQPNDALIALQEAVAHGFPFGCDVRRDPDFQRMKADERFAPLVEVIEARGTRPCLGS